MGDVVVTIGGELIFDSEPLPNLCGHADADIEVQWAGYSNNTKTHTICGNCYRKGIYYVNKRG